MPADPQTDRPRHSVSAEGEQERRFVTTPPMHPKPTPRPPQRRQAPPPKQQKPAQPVPFTLDPEALFAKAATISKPGRALAALASAEHPDRLYAAALVLRRELSAERLAHTRMTVDIIRNRLWRREHRLALALAMLDSDSDEEAFALIDGDGVPTAGLPERMAEFERLRKEGAADDHSGAAKRA